MTQEAYQNYLKILQEELVPALGCTEPIAIAFAAAKARDVLGMLPDRTVVECSGNIIKNVKGVIVPATKNLRGMEAAAIIGIVGGDPSKGPGGALRRLRKASCGCEGMAFKGRL